MDKMKYYVIEIAEGDARIAGKGIYEYATLDEAVASFHGKMSTAMKSELYTREMLTILNSAGGQYEKYTDVFERVVNTEE